MKKSFFDYEKPIIAMVAANDAAEMKALALNALTDGADVVGFCMEFLELEQRTDEILTDLFGSFGEHPVYVTCYRKVKSKGQTDDQCVDYLFQCLRCGATFGDVMGDLYCEEPTGMTFDETAAKKQTEVIEKIHAMGKETLISTHTKKFLTPEELLRYAKGQQARGTDLIKIVNYAATEEELVENMKTIKLFSENLEKPFVLLANGPECRPLRLDGAAKGACTFFCRTSETGEQPLVKTAKYWRDGE